MNSFQRLLSILLVVNASSLFLTVSLAAPTLEARKGQSGSEGSTLSSLLGANFVRDWIGGVYGLDSLSAADKQAFSKTLTGVTVGAPLPNAEGENNDGLAVLSGTYEGHPGASVIAKAMKAADTKALAEVKAMKTLMPDVFIDSGLVAGWPKSKSAPGPVILMKKVPGQPIEHIDEWEKASEQAKKTIYKAVETKVCEQVVKWAMEKKVLFADFHPENVLVQIQGGHLTSMHMIDPGYPGVFHVKPTVKEADVKQWCAARFEALWEDLL
ncbi:hypothetical protein GYMLUDRAFT_56509 [Collybiopsis luxurians FD-317 M1]|nr:hypothetical protein GYMLUDRAFT_56509 [Collybiopsis luxurians FD-317 M1]